MNKIFEVKARVQRTQENGYIKKVTETYLVEAATFGEAEKLVCIVISNQQDEYEIKSVRISPIKDVFGNKAEGNESYYVATVEFISLTDDGREKKVKRKFLVAANDIATAQVAIGIQLHIMGEYRIDTIQETDILEYLKVKENT